MRCGTTVNGTTVKDALAGSPSRGQLGQSLPIAVTKPRHRGPVTVPWHIGDHRHPENPSHRRPVTVTDHCDWGPVTVKSRVTMHDLDVGVVHS